MVIHTQIVALKTGVLARTLWILAFLILLNLLSNLDDWWIV
jgi:hypothetical protein